MNHEFLNEIILVVQQEINNELFSSDKQPGGLYHVPVILFNPKDDSTFTQYDEEKSNVHCPSCSIQLPLRTSNIKTVQVKIPENPIYARRLLGYTFISRISNAVNKTEAIKSFRPFIKEIMLDLKTKIGAHGKSRLVGEYILEFCKDKQGNYFSELESSAGYQLVVKSLCAAAPPEYIDISKEDPKDYKKFNLTWSKK